MVIGAVIWGTINWMTHGAEFNLQGLGYFGVGALAGALAAGIGAGVGGLVSGAGSFSFGVAQGLTVGGIGAGAAVGASVGFTSGFITGTGNSLLQHNNIGNSLLNGLKSGGMGAAIGAVTGGIAGGIRAHGYGGNIWTGKRAPVVWPKASIKIPDLSLSGRSEISFMDFPEKSYSQPIPNILQNGRMACTETAISAADQSLGGNMSPSAIRNLTMKGSNPDEVGLKTAKAFSEYARATHHMVGSFPNTGSQSTDQALYNFTQGNRVLLKYGGQNNNGLYHLVNLAGVSRSIENGYQYTIMDPAIGSTLIKHSLNFVNFFYLIEP